MNSKPLSLSMDIVADDAVLEDALGCPDSATDLVIFAHGSESSRFSPRNRYVTNQLHAADLGALLSDLSSVREVPHASCRFDIALLACRPQRAVYIVGSVTHERSLRLGYFGTSTGVAAAILTVSGLDNACTIEAVVSRGGHLDLTGQRALARLTYPTLLVIGATDLDALDLSRQALSQMHREKALETVPRATYLFEEVGVLEQVIGLTRVWFVRHLSATV